MMMTTVPPHQQSEDVIQEAFQLFDLLGTNTSLMAYRIDCCHHRDKSYKIFDAGHERIFGFESQLLLRANQFENE